MMTLYPIAKINLGLNVVDRREDGYHDLETVFWPVDGIRDELTVTESREPGAHLTVKGIKGEICSPEKNLVVKAYSLIKADYDLPGVNIELTKQIPSQAGMGGGSSDGAYMIRALNELFSLGLTTAQMQGYAARLGADCAFFITAEPSYAIGIGDRLTPIERELLIGANPCSLVLVKPDVAVSTKEAYAGITPKKPQRNCRDIILNEPIENWRDMLVNDFEESIFPKLPVLKEVKEQLYEDGALYAAMSGSGSTVFGIFDAATLNTKLSTLNSRYAKYFHKIVSF